MSSEIVATIRSLMASGESSQAVRLIRGQLFDVSRGREFKGPEGFEFMLASWELGLAEETVQWARLVRRVGDEAERVAQARITELAALTELNRFGEALDVIRAVPGPPGEISAYTLAQLHMQEGLILGKMGLTDEALQRYALAEHSGINADPELMTQLLVNQGGALDDLGRPDEALAVYERAIALGPNEPLLFASYVNMGNSLRALRRFDEADQAYAIAARYTQDDPLKRGVLLSNHARVLLAGGRTRDAKRMLKDAIDLRQHHDPGGAAITAGELAKLLEGEGDFRLAIYWTGLAIDLRRSTGQPDGDLTQLMVRLAEKFDVITSNPDEACKILLQRLRAEPPGEWPLITANESSLLLRLVAKQLRIEAGQVVSPGRRVEDRWLLVFLTRQASAGHQMAMAEHNDFLAGVGRHISLAREMLRLKSWLERKRFYESHQEQLESLEFEDVMSLLEGRAAEAGMSAAGLAGIQRLVCSCKDRGINIAFAELPEEHPNELINRLLMVGTWREAMMIVQAHPELLNDERLSILEQIYEHGSPDSRARVSNHLQVLQRCSVVGVTQAFTEAPSLGNEPLGTKYEVYSYNTVSDEGQAISVNISEPVARARARSAEVARSGNVTQTRASLMDLGQIMLAQPTADRTQLLREALAVYEQAADVKGAWTQDEIAQLCLQMADVLLELATAEGGSSPNAVLAARQFSRALDVSSPIFTPTRARRAAIGVHHATEQYLTSAPDRSSVIQLRQSRADACRIAITATDELLRSGSSVDASSERYAVQWAYDTAVEDLFSLGEFATALAMVEHSRARRFLSELGSLQRLPAGLPAELMERESSARDTLQEAREANDSNAFAAALRQLRSIYDDLARLAPEFARARAGQPPTAAEITEFARGLDIGTVVLAWYMTPTQGFAFAMHSGTGEVRGSQLKCDQGTLEKVALQSCWPTPANPPVRPYPISKRRYMLSAASSELSTSTLVAKQLLKTFRSWHPAQISCILPLTVLISQPIRWTPGYCSQTATRESNRSQSAMSSVSRSCPAHSSC